MDMMEKTRSERLLQWLRDAHAMEAEATTMLTAQASRLDNYPQLRQRIEEHIRETKQQSQLLESCLERLGGSPSTAKNVIASGMAAMHAAGNSAMSDEVVKGMGISYAFEHVEISAYRSLILAAEAAGDTETARICRDEILPQEVAMAQWLYEHQDSVVQNFLQREQEPDVQAKR